MERFPTCCVRLNQQRFTKSEFHPRTRVASLGEFVLPEPSRTLHTIKIYLPSKAELVPVAKTTSYLGALGTLMSGTPSVVQGSSNPPPRVVHRDSVMIPKGFNCGLCRPATDGTLVYLLARTRQRFVLSLSAYVFWVFVYDWKTGRGLQVRLPEVEKLLHPHNSG